MEEQVIAKFDMDSGSLCLDFVNTLDWHASDHPEEELASFADLLTWGREAGLLTSREAGQLLRQSQEQPGEARRWLAEAVRLREALYRVFVSIANAPHSDPIAAADVAVISAFWQQAAQYRRLAADGAAFRWEWALQATDLGRVLWPVAQCAVDVLESDLRTRIGQCQDDRGCGFLFIDTSRNRSRRWCSMDSCGNRAKAARHHAREKRETTKDTKVHEGRKFEGN